MTDKVVIDSISLVLGIIRDLAVVIFFFNSFFIRSLTVRK